jgi:hypothetical protein
MFIAAGTELCIFCPHISTVFCWITDNHAVISTYCLQHMYDVSDFQENRDFQMNVS